MPDYDNTDKEKFLLKSMVDAMDAQLREIVQVAFAGRLWMNLKARSAM